MPDPKKIPVKLKKEAERMVRKEHPWVFESSLSDIGITGNAGDVVIVFDQKKNRFMGFGLWDPDSPIRVKMLHFKTSAKFDEEWINQRILSAYTLRSELLKTDTDSYRLIFGENDLMPSLIVDIYAKVAVIKLYSRIWVPYLDWIVNAVVNTTLATTVVLRLSRSVSVHEEKLKEGQILHGTLDDPEVIFTEHGLKFSANVLLGHKTGYFLDHRENRRMIGAMANRKSVLDVFAYAGGFSVHALVGGATEVTSLDISRQALDMSIANAALNKFKGQHYTICGDAFEELSKLKQQNKTFDIVVIDPPSFAKKTSEISGALHSYRRLAKLGIALVKPKGTLVLASCSSRVTSEEFFNLCEDELKLSKRPHQILNKTYHDEDHPVSFAEGAYLKCIYFVFST